MKKIIFVFLLAIHSFAIMAQPGGYDPNETIGFKLYDKHGKIISPDTKDVSVSFLFNNFSDTIHDRVLYSQTQVVFTEGMFKVEISRDSEVTITLTQKKATMIIHTVVSIDSISFREGEYRIEKFHSALFNQIATYNKAKIINSDLNDFKINASIKTPFYEYSITPTISRKENVDECRTYSKKIENEHGGVNWAENTCNNMYQPIIINDKDVNQIRINKICSTNPNKIRIKIYPFKKNILIKHEFFLSSTYRHLISISYDFGESWTEIISVTDEWYVSIVYFPDIERIGIVGHDFLLISDYNLKDWKYYYLNYSNVGAKSDNYAGLVLRNENWFDNYFGYFKFSE